MRLITLLFLVFICSDAFSEDQFRLDGQAEPSSYIHGYVNAITGSLVYSVPDIVVEGPEPLSFIRHYCSNNTQERKFGEGFSHNHATETTELDLSVLGYRTLSIEESCGDKVNYTTIRNTKAKEHWFYVDPQQLRYGFTNCSGGEISGRNNIKNNKLLIVGNVDYAREYECTSFLGDGSVRYYRKDSLLSREIRPSGNQIRYSYNKDKTLSRIESTDSSSKVIFGWIQFTYDKNTVNVQASNGKKGTYSLNHHRLRHSTVTGSPDCSMAYTTTHESLHGKKKHVLSQIAWEDGENLEFEYKHNRIDAIRASDGKHDEKLFEIKHRPDGKYTTVKDIGKGKTIYSYTDSQRLSKKERYDKGSLYSAQKFFWGGHHKCPDSGKPLTDDEGYLLTKGVANHIDDLLAVITYSYDDRGNVLKDTIAGSLTGKNHPKPIKINGKIPELTNHETYSKTYTYSTDGLNLVTSETEEDGLKVVWKYLKNTDRPIQKLCYAKKSIYSREFYEYNEYRILVRKTVDDGCREDPKDLHAVTQRILTTIRPNMKTGTPGFGKPLSIIENYWDPLTKTEKRLKRTDFTYGAFDLVTSEAHYDAEDKLRYTLYWKYDSLGNCIQETDPDGRIIVYKYNKGGLCTYKELLGSGFSTAYSYDNRGRLITTAESHATGDIFIQSNELDSLGRKISETDPFGQKTTFHYDSLGRLERIKSPSFIGVEGNLLSPVNSKTYNIFDQVTTETDAAGNQIRKSYNCRGQITEICYLDGTTEKYLYNLNGTLSKKINRNSVYSQLHYDDQRRLILEETCDLNGKLLKSRAFHYQGNNLIFEIDPMGLATEFKYDGAGRKIAKIVHGDRTLKEQYLYDALGRLGEEKKWYGEGEEDYLRYIKKFDLLNRVIEERTQDVKGTCYSLKFYTYDRNGNCTEEKTIQEINRPLIHRYEYNSLHLLTKSIDPEGNTTYYHYDFNHKNDSGQNVLKSTTVDPKGTQTIIVKDVFGRESTVEKRSALNELLSSEKFFYDVRGLKVKTQISVIANGKTIREYAVYWKHDALGRVIELVEDPLGKNKRTLMNYNSLDLLASKTKPSGVVLTYTYDALGRQTKISSSDGSISYTFEYDLNDRLTLSQDLISKKNLSRAYDTFGNLSCETLPNGCELSYQHDGFQRVTEIQLPDGSAIGYHYTADNMRRVQRFSSNGVEIYAHEYEETNLLGKSLKSTLLTGDKVLFSWDARGKMASMENTFARESIPPKGYDALGNLQEVSFKGPWGNKTDKFKHDFLNHLIFEDSIQTHQYSTDSLDNRLSKDKFLYNVNSLNQTENDGKDSYDYDRNGNLVSRKVGGKKILYQYDALDRLFCISKEKEWLIWHSYDSYHRCLERKKFHWVGSKWEEVEQLRFIYQGVYEIGVMDKQNKIKQLKVLGKREGQTNRCAVAIELEGKIFAPLFDHRFNIMCLINQASRETESYRYSAFGEVDIFDSKGTKIPISQIGNPWLFSGKRYDTQTELCNFGRRHYFPQLSVWISPDPGGFVDGLNLYAYTHHCPLTCTDYLGFLTRGVSAHYGGLVRPSDEVMHRWGESIETLSHHCIPIPQLQYLGEGVGRFMQRKSFSHSYTGDIRPLSDKVGNGTLGNKRVRAFFGILTDAESARSHAKFISEQLGGTEVHISSNLTKGFANDVLLAGAEYLDMGLSLIKEIHGDILQDYHEMKNAYQDNFSLHYTPHSRGTTELNFVCKYLPNEIKSKINVYSLGAAKLISRGNFNSAVNYVNDDDIVYKLGKLGATLGWLRSPITTFNETFLDKPEIVYTGYSSNKWNSCIQDHFLNCPGYRKAIETISKNIQAKTGRWFIIENYFRSVNNDPRESCTFSHPAREIRRHFFFSSFQPHFC